MAVDECYSEIDGRRWRRTDAAIPLSLNAELVSELMAARRAAPSRQGKTAMTALRSQLPGLVHDARVALGERGRP